MVSKHAMSDAELLEVVSADGKTETKPSTSPNLTVRKLGAQLLVCTVIFIASIAFAALLGSSALHMDKVFDTRSVDHEVFFVLRLPRALLAGLAGGSLALAGVLFQALLRDSLATPSTLGVSSGASLGAVIAIWLGLDTIAGFSGVTALALMGAGLVLLAIAQIASRRGMSSTSLLLAGITINSIVGAVIIFLQSISSFTQSTTITRWLLGALDAPKYSVLLEMTVILIPTCLATWWFARGWNLLAIGEDWANARGISAGKFLIAGFVFGSIIAGTVAAYTGPIGFVGLIVPHALRLRLGADHRVLIPCSFLLGGAFLALCDLLSRVVLAPTEIPVGVVTALLGGPFFIWMLYTRETHTRG